jgi:adenylate kinase family enzyme
MNAYIEINPELIAQHYVAKLKYLNLSKPKFLVLFSGPPASGKSYLSKHISRHFKGVRLENDAIREAIYNVNHHIPSHKRQELVNQIMHLVRNEILKKHPNKFWIQDSSIDRKFDDTDFFAEKNGFKTFIIAIKLPKEKLIERINQRNSHSYISANEQIKLLDGWIDDQEKFLSKVNPDITMEEELDCGDIIEAIELKLAEQ